MRLKSSPLSATGWERWVLAFGWLSSRRRSRVAVVLIVLFLVAFHAAAQDIEPTTFWKRIQDKGLYERLWEATRLYENEDNSVIQAFSIIGRYHGQYWSVNADQGNADGWENRRILRSARKRFFSTTSPSRRR